jgi:hypothetical protein
MTVARRVAASLLAGALVAAGCTSSVPPAPTAATATPAPAGPTANAPATPTPTTAPPTPFACPTLPSAVDASLDLGVATGVVVIPLEPGVEVPGPAASIEPIDPADIAIEGTALGATELHGTLAIAELADDPSIVITSLTARFVPLDASATSAVGVAIDGATTTITLPNRNADGRLLLAVAWSSSCGSGSGGGGVALTVVNSKVAAGCPTTDDEVAAALADLRKLRITIGGVSEPLDIYSWQTRWMPGNGIDDFGTLFPNWNRDTVITVAPGANVAVREKVDTLELVSVRAAIYRRADVDAYFELGSTQEVDPVTVVRRSVNPNGNVNVPAPLDRGSYVFAIDATWLTSCFELHTFRTVSVKVS